MEIAILKKIKEKLRIDFPDEWIENSEIKFLDYQGGKYVLVSEKIVHRYYRIISNDGYEQEYTITKETDIPDELKKMFLEASNVYEEKEFDPLEVPCRMSFLYEDMVNRGELLGEDLLAKHGLSKKKK